MAINDLRAVDWLYPAANDRSTWHEIRAEHYDEMLCVLPPIYRPAGFMMIEAADHGGDGIAVRSYFVEVPKSSPEGRSRYFVRDVRDTPKSAQAALAQLRDELKAA